ncbi:MAG TPA: cytochrome c3 family protein [Acidobacteriaceae bacterium]
MSAQTASGAQPAADHPAEKQASDANASCAACHADIAKQYSEYAAVHAKNGVTCATCHPVADAAASSEAGADGTARRKPGTVAEVNEGCASCHAEVAADFKHPHPVIEVEGCVSCHAAHGSANADMLTKSDPNALCAQCHIPAHEKAGAAVSAAGPAARCTDCHGQIHGSNTSQVFTK